MKASEFDYVVVGAGSAGCALANRLSETAGRSVLIVEAGRWAKTWMRSMPAAVKQMMARSEIAWGFRSSPESGLNSRELNLRRGKVVGGCSQINGMIYSRGHPADYDDWAARGCTGWSYADVLPYFRRSESSWSGENDVRGGSGPLAVSRPNLPELMIDLFREATRKAGYPGSDDYHTDYKEGFTPVELTVGRGRRASTGVAYLAPALKRRNLTLLTDTHVGRVIIENRRAVGIECIFPRGRAVRISARAEVILTAGTYGSPHLLMLSGIGEADALRRKGINVVHPSPEVGRNLVEHPLFPMHFSAHPRTFLNELRVDRAVLSILEWAAFGRGPFATNACAGNAYIKSRPALDRPDIQLNMAALHLGAWLWAPWISRRPEHGLTTNVIALTQESRGSVSLTSADPFLQPRIQLNLLTESADVRLMIRGMRIARDIYCQAPLSDLVISEITPGTASATDSELEAVLRAGCFTAEHPIGTCRMGADAHAVVDPQLRINGIDGLRVADASIMPTIVSGNTNAPTIMIAERAADLIKGV
jgi:choline dehydrogenase